MIQGCKNTQAEDTASSVKFSWIGNQTRQSTFALLRSLRSLRSPRQSSRRRIGILSCCLHTIHDISAAIWLSLKNCRTAACLQSLKSIRERPSITTSFACLQRTQQLHSSSSLSSPPCLAEEGVSLSLSEDLNNLCSQKEGLSLCRP